MNRPEITRSNEYLAKDQREMIDKQKRKLEFIESQNSKIFNAILASKIFSNFHKSADDCLNLCIDQPDKNSIETPFARILTESKSIKNSLCWKNCLSKRKESFEMLINYFFAKMKYDNEKKNDIHLLYEIPEKFRDKQL